MRDIGKNIRAARIRKKMTQDELAEKLFVTRQTVSNYETGRSRPDVEYLMSISEILGVELNELLYGPLQLPEKKRELRKFIIVAAIHAAVWITVLIAMPDLNNFAGTYHIMFPLFIIRGFVFPALYFMLGWLVVSACGIFLGAKPLRFPAKKIVRVAAFVLLVIFLVLLLPTSVSIIGLLVEEIKILLADEPHSLSWSLGGNIPIIRNISLEIYMFLYRFPYVTLPFGAISWLLGIPKHKQKSE